MINFNPNLPPNDQPDDELCQENGFEDAEDYQKSLVEEDSFDDFLLGITGEVVFMELKRNE